MKPALSLTETTAKRCPASIRRHLLVLYIVGLFPQQYIIRLFDVGQWVSMSLLDFHLHWGKWAHQWGQPTLPRVGQPHLARVAPMAPTFLHFASYTETLNVLLKVLI